eukprot:15471136-Alexandrium_andersonii.AAC.1
MRRQRCVRNRNANVAAQVCDTVGMCKTVCLAMRICDTVGMCNTASVWPESGGHASRCVGKRQGSRRLHTGPEC